MSEQAVHPSLLRRLWQSRWGIAFVAPAMLLLIAVHVVPILYVAGLSFSRYTVQTGQQEWIGLANYQALVKDPLFYKAAWNTVLYTVLVVPVALALALGLAFMVQPLGPRAQTFFKSAFYLPGMVSSVVLALVWAWLYNADFGLFNYLLGLVGIEPIVWLGDSRVALPAVALMTVFSGLGVPLLLLLAAMGNIPEDYYEAADIDGAGPVHKFFAITLPLLRPTLLYLLIVMTIGSFQVFDAVYLMTNGGPNYATTTLVFLIYESAFRFFDFGLAGAQAIVLFLAVVLLAVIQFAVLNGDVEA